MGRGAVTVPRTVPAMRVRSANALPTQSSGQLRSRSSELRVVTTGERGVLLEVSRLRSRNTGRPEGHGFSRAAPCWRGKRLKPPRSAWAGPPQGLKPHPSLHDLMARLKPCPSCNSYESIYSAGRSVGTSSGCWCERQGRRRSTQWRACHCRTGHRPQTQWRGCPDRAATARRHRRSLWLPCSY